MTLVVRVAALAFALVIGACSSAQDPGIPASDPQTTQTTSAALTPCPPGGPDASTPAVGCVDADGVVQRP